MANLKLVLDTNEFIFAFGLTPLAASQALIETILLSFPRLNVFAPRLIFNEIKNNLSKTQFKTMLTTMRPVWRIDEDMIVPFTLSAKYQSIGLKEADAFIAAYAELVLADFMISENRHFLARQSGLPFKVVSASAFLTLFKKM